MACDVFISYRRQDGIYPAMILYRDLVDAGYNAFYDIASIHSGEFPELIESNIMSCTDFVLVVSKSTFSSRIEKETDWVRKEIALALKLKKNIIPYFAGKVSIPDNLPEDISAVLSYNGVTLMDPTISKETNQKLFSEFLDSKAERIRRSSLQNARCSVYDASYGNEMDRLKLQAQNALESDDFAINRYVACDRDISVLDVGCSYGFVGQSRFSHERFSRIIGIDWNETCITKARELNSDERFCYYTADIESTDFPDRIGQIMEENGIEGFDVVFIALVVHHLKNPVSLLSRIKACLKPNGIIIVRGSDDGSKLAFPEKSGALMSEIIDRTARITGVSDRFNGRKIYNLLYRSGFKDISIHSFMRDTSKLEYDERARLFSESFSYRINYIRREYDANPSNRQIRADFNRMEELLAMFEEHFYDPGFWYCEYDYIGVATKKA